MRSPAALREITLAEILDHYDLAPPLRQRHGGVLPAIDRDDEGYVVRLVARSGDHLRWIGTDLDGVIKKPVRYGPGELREGVVVGLADAYDRYQAALRVITRLDVEADR